MRFNRLGGILCAVLWLLALPQGAGDARAAARWVPAGFGGAGNFLSVQFHPDRPGVVYLTSDVAGVFYSENYGERWQFRSLGLGNYEVSSFAIDPFDPDTLYAGVGALARSDKAGIYVSRDAGVSWRHLTDSAAQGISFRNNRTPRAIAPDPARQGVILSGSRKRGIWRSTDGGERWDQVYAPPMTGARPHYLTAGSIVDDPDEASYPAPVAAIVFDPQDPEIVFAAVYGAGIVRSSAAGIAGSWQEVNRGLPAQPIVLDIAVATDGALYAALERAGLYKSEDGGDSWRPFNGGLPLDDLRVLSVAADPLEPRVAYVATAPVPNPDDYHAPIWKTEDGGASWRATGKVAFDLANNPTGAWRYPPAESWQIAIDPNDPARLFFTEAWSANASADGGRSWRSLIRGAQNTCVTDLVALPDGRPNGAYSLYATHLDAGLLVSRDRGASWEAVLPRVNAQYRGLAGHYWRVLVTGDGARPRVFTSLSPWHRDYGQVLRSDDLVRWQPVFTEPVPDAPWTKGETYIAADPTDGARFFLAQDGGRIFVSEDGGASWAPTAGQPKARRYLDILVDEGGRVFAASFHSGLWRSDNGGRSWRRVLTDQKLIWDIASADGRLYAATDDGNLHRSGDGGQVWRRVSAFAPDRDPDGTANQALAVAVDPADPNHIVMSRVDHWHPTDNGDGVFESRDGGASWRPINDGLGHLRVQRLTFAPDGALFAGTSCGGIWRRDAER